MTQADLLLDAALLSLLLAWLHLEKAIYLARRVGR
jgi:hypothetical protein